MILLLLLQLNYVSFIFFGLQFNDVILNSWFIQTVGAVTECRTY